jgi:hypothetical protein
MVKSGQQMKIAEAVLATPLGDDHQEVALMTREKHTIPPARTAEDAEPRPPLSRRTYDNIYPLFAHDPACRCCHPNDRPYCPCPAPRRDPQRAERQDAGQTPSRPARAADAATLHRYRRTRARPLALAGLYPLREGDGPGRRSRPGEVHDPDRHRRAPLARQPLPNGKRHRPMGTVLLMGEDGAADTIVPRLMNAEADLTEGGHARHLPGRQGAGNPAGLPQRPAAPERGHHRGRRRAWW